MPESLPREEWPSSQQSPKKQPQRGLFDKQIAGPAIKESFRKLDPRLMAKNPVMFIVEIGSVYTTLLFLQQLPKEGEPHLFTGLVAAWLWFTVLFANFAEAMAEGRGKAQADTLEGLLINRHHDHRTVGGPGANVIAQPAKQVFQRQGQADHADAKANAERPGEDPQTRSLGALAGIGSVAAAE